MKESYYVGAYWGCRPESAEQSARRAETFFRLMAASHPDYARWFLQANSTRRALHLQFEPSRDTFERFFGKKRYQAGRAGFRFAAWTGHVKQDKGGMIM
ncbi:MAG TPA: Imm52 family immunity protein, partial [Myxococcaceae bacterium]|nr:Imm52 family immunity protein [Myxococcaceae bacterium]